MKTDAHRATAAMSPEHIAAMRAYLRPLIDSPLIEFIDRHAREREVRVTELLEYNNREVERRRVAISALRTVLARIEGTLATMWHARKEDGPEGQYSGSLAEFLRAVIAAEHN